MVTSLNHGLGFAEPCNKCFERDSSHMWITLPESGSTTSSKYVPFRRLMVLRFVAHLLAAFHQSLPVKNSMNGFFSPVERALPRRFAANGFMLAANSTTNTRLSDPHEGHGMRCPSGSSNPIGWPQPLHLARI